MINGKPRHSQSQGSVERANQDIEKMLNCWKVDNNSNAWSKGLRFVQYAKNARKHSGIGVSPFEAQFGFKAQLGVDCLNLDRELLNEVKTEEELEKLLVIQTSKEPMELHAEESIAETLENPLEEPLERPMEQTFESVEQKSESLPNKNMREGKNVT